MERALCGSRDGANTALHMVSAFATHSGLCQGQEGTRGKGNEITGIKAPLEALTLKGCTVTIDAIGCQREVAEKIVGQGGDYLLALKANQGRLLEAVEEFYAEGQRRGFGRLAVAHTRSRPAVSNDNPYVESAFRTLKYRPQLPVKPFENLLAARRWVTDLAHWGKPSASPQRHRLRDTGTAPCRPGQGLA